MSIPNIKIYSVKTDLSGWKRSKELGKNLSLFPSFNCQLLLLLFFLRFRPFINSSIKVYLLDIFKFKIKLLQL